MKKGIIYKSFIYTLSVSFLLMMSGFPAMLVEAKEGGLPVGEMISRGGVKFEARENVWKEVESSHFPIFQGQRIKTEKGTAIVTHSNSSQIEVSSDSLFSFDQNDHFVLSQGNIIFRVPSSSEINFTVGNLSILKSRSLQATKGPSVSSANDGEARGSISIHSNGGVTVKSIQGRLSILNQDHVVLAALSSNESITIPSVTVGGPARVMVAQAGPSPEEGEEKGGILGLGSTWDWVIGLGGVGIVTAVVIGASGGGGGGHHGVVCP